MKHIILISALSILSVSLQASDGDYDFSPDRPGMATGTGVLNAGFWQFETGFGYESDKREDVKTFTLNTSMLRYGLTGNTELRLQLDGFGVQEAGSNKFSAFLAPPVIGTKIRICEEKGIIPQTSFMANLNLPFLSTRKTQASLFPQLYLLFDNTLTDWLSLGYNLGLEWNGLEAAPVTFAAICLDFSITESTGAFLESYNYFSKGEKPSFNFDLGLSWNVLDNLQLDLFAAVNLNNISSYFNVGFGLAWLIGDYDDD